MPTVPCYILTDANKRISYYVGPIPLGPWPVAVFSGVAFAMSVVIWGLARRGRRKSG